MPLENGERVASARRPPAEDTVRGGRGNIWEERSISSQSWHDQFHVDGRLQLDQIAAVSRAVQASRAMASTALSCEAMRAKKRHEEHCIDRPCAGGRSVCLHLGCAEACRSRKERGGG